MSPTAPTQIVARRSVRVISALAIWMAAGAGVHAQCGTPGWTAVSGSPGTSGQVYAATLWDADGAGAGSPLLVVAGEFSIAGDTVAGNIAAYDLGTGTWSTFGSGTPAFSPIRALTVMSDGSLVAGGEFSQIGGVPANNIARWNGSAWTALGDGVQQADIDTVGVHALAVLPTGTLVAGGDFLMAGSSIAHSIAVWNGTFWNPLGSGMGGSSGQTPVSALAVLLNGHLIVGGDFLLASGTPANHIARWTGTSWQALGTGMDQSVHALDVAPNGNLIAAGAFTQAGTAAASRIARWNSTSVSAGTVWSALGTGLNGTARSVDTQPNGDVMVGGEFTEAGGATANHVARWNGAAWSALATGVDDIFSEGVARAIKALPGGDTAIGGSFTFADNTSATHIAIWNGSAWESLGQGLDDVVYELEPMSNGDVLVAGAFSGAGGVRTNVLARWNGSTWSQIGPVSFGTAGAIQGIAELANGDLAVSGNFWMPGTDWRTDPPVFVAHWDGSAWSDMGMPLDGQALAIAALPTGGFVVGGAFTSANGIPANCIAKWDGTNWSALGDGLGAGGTTDFVGSLLVMPNGDIIAAGVFSFSGELAMANIARWDGSSWTPLAATMDFAIDCLSLTPAGGIVAGGQFSSIDDVPADGVAVYNGSNWSALGSGIDGGFCDSLLCTPGGDIYALGAFFSAGGQPARNIARWNGTAWSALGQGIDSLDEYCAPRSIVQRSNGEIVVGGTFFRVDGLVSVNIARYCPAAECPADFNQSGAVTVQDIFDFLNAYFAGSPAADFNQTGGLTVQDIFDFLGAYFAGCN